MREGGRRGEAERSRARTPPGTLFRQLSQKWYFFPFWGLASPVVWFDMIVAIFLATALGSVPISERLAKLEQSITEVTQRSEMSDVLGKISDACKECNQRRVAQFKPAAERQLADIEAEIQEIQEIQEKTTPSASHSYLQNMMLPQLDLLAFWKEKTAELLTYLEAGGYQRLVALCDRLEGENFGNSYKGLYYAFKQRFPEIHYKLYRGGGQENLDYHHSVFERFYKPVFYDVWRELYKDNDCGCLMN